ncbi:MAG: DUF1015 domain-containing protein [Deltaproteobacteria bacterium]|nr:DUF1015 domain-containing protein [Deltaproteobacteria bacterium]
MATISPFRGIRYDPARVGDLSRVVAPPYDVIPPELHRRLLERHPRNIVHIDFGPTRADDTPGRDRYSRAAAHLRAWQDEGTLVRDPRPALYLYEQEFSLDPPADPAGPRPPTADPRRFPPPIVRRGFLAALRLSPFGAGVVFPHERTLSAPKLDRLALLRATETDTSPVFALYSDPADTATTALRAAADRPPDMVATDDAGVVHRCWRIDDAGAVGAAVRDLDARRLFIADGHHRYETTLGWRDELRARTGGRPDAAPEFILAFLCNMDAPGLVILPTHRGLHGVEGFTEAALLSRLRAVLPVATHPGGPLDAARAVAGAAGGGKALAWTAGGGRYHVVEFPAVEAFGAEHLACDPPELRTLDVVLLHDYVFQELLGIAPEDVTRGRYVRYYKEAGRAAADLAAGELQAAFFLNPVGVEEFRRVSLSGHVLPQKTTFFHPKVFTGFVLLSARPDEAVPG